MHGGYSFRRYRHPCRSRCPSVDITRRHEHPKLRYLWAAVHGRYGAPVSVETPVPVEAYTPPRLPIGVLSWRARLASALDTLTVSHRPGNLDGIDEPPATESDALRIRTCQREIRIATQSQPLPDEAAAEILRGVDAYRFLLEFASGLRSAIPGETNVFGQLRDAWRAYERDRPRAVTRSLAPLMDALIRDTREIRTQFLQGIGGHSYAALTRRLLEPHRGARVLIVGYGALGRSMPAKFADAELAICNRTAPADLPESVRFFGAGAEAEAAQWATHVIFCVPRRAAIDALWVPLLRARPHVPVAHLGCHRADAGPWRDVGSLIDLDRIFELQLEQTRRRTLQLAQARAACALLAARTARARG
jgi:hypothetical protein